LAWRFGFVGALLVNLKQANPVLLALVTVGLAVIALRDPKVAKRRALAELPRMLGPAIIVFVVWRWYVIANAPHGENAFRPFDTWNFDVLPTLFAALWQYITDAPLFHAMMWMVTAAGLVSFSTLPHETSEARRLAVVCATVWLGYNAFLLAVYLGAFNRNDAEMAADYWRYAPHVALLGLYAPVLALATVRTPKWMSLRGAVPSLAAALVALCALPVRGDLNNPRDRAWPHFIRDVATDIRHAILPGSKVAIISCWKENLFEVIVRYDLWQLGAPGREIAWTVWADDDDADPTAVTSLAMQGETNYLVIQDADCEWDGDDTDKLGLSPIDHEVALFAWRNNAWEKVKSWPIPPAFIHRDP
jgi:hypothetical protein